jgi:hypothetical protein
MQNIFSYRIILRMIRKIPNALNVIFRLKRGKDFFNLIDIKNSSQIKKLQNDIFYSLNFSIGKPPVNFIRIGSRSNLMPKIKLDFRLKMKRRFSEVF